MPEHDNQNLHQVQAQGGFGEPGAFAEEVARLAEGEDMPRELREALLLRPGRGTGSPLRTGRPLRLRAIPIAQALNHERIVKSLWRDLLRARTGIE